MNKIVVLFILVSCSLFSFGQQKQETNLIQADSTWAKEIIEIPFWFAPEINYTGYEDIRFAKGWEKTDSSGFWTYAFAWNINLKTKPSAKFFEDNLKYYFDGLMKVVNKDTLFTIPKTKALFVEKGHKNKVTTFTGTLEIYDAFTTKKVITLNVIIESYYCRKSKTFVPLLKFSPKDFKHESWEMLKQVKIGPNFCKEK